MKVKVINISENNLPVYETPASAGLDLKAAITEPIIIKAHDRALIPTGLKMAIPEGYECQIRPRSGLALKKGITVLNTPGTIDADYRQEVGVILMNHSDERFEVNPGDRIAQAVFNKFERIEWEEVEELEETERKGGFGSTGV
jgi:dUTP pyrophosphatase